MQQNAATNWRNLRETGIVPVDCSFLNLTLFPGRFLCDPIGTLIRR
jgi:hypothetical protein